MRTLDLDFRRQRPASPWAGWVLLAIALALMTDLGISYYAARRAVAQNEARLAKMGRPADGAGRAAAQSTGSSPEEFAVARETIQRLSMPWDNLFGALESAATDQVALLAIEPDPKAGTVAISAEGKDYAAALNYVRELGRARTLTQVHLVKHELQESDPQRPVAFSVSASWSKSK